MATMVLKCPLRSCNQFLRIGYNAAVEKVIVHQTDQHPVELGVCFQMTLLRQTEFEQLAKATELMPLG